tara:strand:+ start:1 stop:747 length:747 start_codon:yes stop_codon:yes gene_type:complete
MWYGFSSHNNSNVFYISTYSCPDSCPDKTHTIEIPPGNYNASVFAEKLNELFVSISGGLQYVSVEVDEITTHTFFRTGGNLKSDGITSYAIKPDSSFNYTIDFSLPGETKTAHIQQKSAGWTMGFRKSIYTNIDHADYLESETSYGSSFYQYVFLEIDDFQRNFSSNTIISSKGDSNLGNNILARITVSSGHNTNIIENGSDLVFKKRNYFGPIRLEKLHIRLLDRFGEVIELNGNDFSFALEIEKLY